MRFRVALWWVSLSGAIGGLLYFLASEVGLHAVAPPYGSLRLEQHTGASLLVAGLADAIDRTLTAFSQIRLQPPDPAIWLSIATLTACIVPLIFRLRPTRRARTVLAIVTAAVLLPTVAAVAGMEQTQAWRFGTPTWVWLGAIVLMCLSPWLRRQDQLAALAAWEARPGKPAETLGELHNIPDGLRQLAHQTRSLRASLDVLTGLDTDTLRLVWDWQERVRACRGDDAALLGELGLDTAPMQRALDREDERDDVGQTEALLELDKALGAFERGLLNYRSFGFR